MLFKKKQTGNILITVTIIKKNFTQLQHIHVTFDKMSSILDVSNLRKITANGICFLQKTMYDKINLFLICIF